MKLFAEKETGKEWKESLTNNNRENGLELMLVSQFTLDAYFKGAKPDFHKAMGGPSAKEIFDYALETAGKMHPKGASHVKTGQFGAMMEVSICNDGPVTILYEYPDPQKKDNQAKGNAPAQKQKDKKQKGKKNENEPKNPELSDKMEEIKLDEK